MNSFDISSFHRDRDRDECRERDRDRDRDDCRDRDRDDCRTVVRKNVGVRTPVSVDVSTRSGSVRIVCSEPHITNGIASEERNSTRCDFTVNQVISVEIPICYRVRTDVRNSYVDCDVDVN